MFGMSFKVREQFPIDKGERMSRKKVNVNEVGMSTRGIAVIIEGKRVVIDRDLIQLEREYALGFNEKELRELSATIAAEHNLTESEAYELTRSSVDGLVAMMLAPKQEKKT
jgi:hypothetical protein